MVTRRGNDQPSSISMARVHRRSPSDNRRYAGDDELVLWFHGFEAVVAYDAGHERHS